MDPATGGDKPDMRHGNTQQYAHGSDNSAAIAPTIMPDRGKWYVELQLESPSGGDYPFFGITDNLNLNQQDGTGNRTVGIDNFSINGSALIPVRWPGGIAPVVTVTASRSDIYSFKIWDGNNAVSEGLYGVIGGQNFA